MQNVFTETRHASSHASTLSIWIEEIKAKSGEEPRKQQLTTTLTTNTWHTRNSSLENTKIYVFVPFLFCFILYLRALSNKPPGVYIREGGGDLTEGFLRYEFEGLIHEGAYFRNFTVCLLQHGANEPKSKCTIATINHQLAMRVKFHNHS